MRLYESDIKPSDRYLMERFITAGFAVHGELQRRDHYRAVHQSHLEAR